jgi:hypothetical protein
MFPRVPPSCNNRDLVESDPTKTIGNVENGDANETGDPVHNAPYIILPPGEKVFVVVVGSFAALISPLSSGVYLPALD